MSEDTKKCTFSPDSQYADFAAEVFSLLADATRVRIILALRHSEHSVSELADRVGKSPTVISQHLAKLRWGRIVEPRKEANRVYYRLIDEHARELVNHAVFQAQHVIAGDSSGYSVPEHHRSGDTYTTGTTVGPDSQNGPR
ncbi:metalloregulator ArsR/SmtB family transcription factor [uncultured Corynebacterium sp.]|uniref:ArsR/SmtB family transcription factor n=1 Tax=uncultured Corynebacterium sp. TaxID=159447 RepID=UPI0025E2FFD5|nr:metalloregulator ArsR/SmtB family transcription factor [uncultured Corynebacterium sp.]